MHLAQNGKKTVVCCDNGDGFLVAYNVGSLVTSCGYSGCCNRSLLRGLRNANYNLVSANEGHKTSEMYSDTCWHYVLQSFVSSAKNYGMTTVRFTRQNSLSVWV